MSLESAIIARLMGDAAYSAAMDKRIDLMRRPGGKLPATTLQVVSDPRPQHFRGFQAVRQSRVQLDVWATSPAVAIAQREAAISILAPAARIGGVTFQRAQVINVRPGFDQEEAGTAQQPQAELYRETVDFIFTHDA